MKLVESILTKNPCYTAGRKIEVKGLMLHSVGCSQPKASAFINSWNSPTFDRACVHGFIDGNDGTVYQTLPWDHRGWHCGSSINGSGNNTHIGVEMCEPACITYTSGATFKCSDLATAKAVAERTYHAAVELFAMLCDKFGLDPLADGVVISHKEGHTRGIASNHGDPEHLWSQLGMGYTMETILEEVKTMTDKEKKQIAAFREEGYSYTQISKMMDLSINSIKTYCKRHDLGGTVAYTVPVIDNGSKCENCGKDILQNPGRKAKRFCCDKCRNQWWNNHMDQVKRKANYEYVCPLCKKVFHAYGNSKRKYCSHACYVEDRFFGGAC